MEILRTSLKALTLLWPLYLAIAAMIAIAGEFVSSMTILGGQIVVYTIVIFLTHHAILSGQNNLAKRGDSEGFVRPLSFNFLGLVLLLIWLPAFCGGILGFVLLSDAVADPTLLLFPFIGLFLWVSLTLFGTSIPRFVWREMYGTVPAKRDKRRRVRTFVATRLLFWNLAYVVLLIALILGLGAISNSIVDGPNMILDLTKSFVVEAFSFVTVTLTTAVLSHAFLGAYDLGPEGLVVNP